MLANITGETNALVRNKFKGKGFGKGGGKSPGKEPGGLEAPEPQQTLRCLMLHGTTRAISATSAMSLDT